MLLSEQQQSSDDVAIKCGVDVFSDFVALVCSKDSPARVHLRHHHHHQQQQQQQQPVRRFEIWMHHSMTYLTWTTDQLCLEMPSSSFCSCAWDLRFTFLFPHLFSVCSLVTVVYVMSILWLKIQIIRLQVGVCRGSHRVSPACGSVFIYLALFNYFCHLKSRDLSVY